MNKNKNNAKRIFKKQHIEERFYLLYGRNKSRKKEVYRERSHKGSLQFHFCLKGGVDFIYNHGKYIWPLKEKKSLILNNPKNELPVNLSLWPNSICVSLFIPIEKMHSFFSKEAHFIAFLNQENRGKKYYREYSVTPDLITVLNQIINHTPN